LLTRPLIVATASPNRRAILADAGLAFDTAVPDVDESILPGDTPEGYVKRLALAKARAVTPPSPDHLVLTADTCIDIEGDILGKPSDEADARAMLMRLSGAWHEVWGGIALRDDGAGGIDVHSVCTRVRFSDLSDDMIDWYVATGEAMGRAGAYAIQGKGRALVAAVDGCFTNVIGISLPAVFEMLGDKRE
jgi:septum formation protein